MKITVLLGVVSCTFALNASAAEMDNIKMFPAARPSATTPLSSQPATSQPNLLSSSDQQKLADFVNTNLPPNWMKIPAYSVIESDHAKLGGGKVALLVLLDISGRGYSNKLLVYNQSSGSNSGQWPNSC